jgi:hypothetical protein
LIPRARDPPGWGRAAGWRPRPLVGVDDVGRSSANARESTGLPRPPPGAHTRATNDQIAADNTGHHRDGIGPGQQFISASIAGRLITPVLSDTDAVAQDRAPAPALCNGQRPAWVTRAPERRGCSEGLLCMSSMKAEGASSHARLLVGGRCWWPRTRSGRVDQSSIRAGSPMVSCGGGSSIKPAAVAQQGHDTHRARPDHAAGQQLR